MLRKQLMLMMLLIGAQAWASKTFTAHVTDLTQASSGITGVKVRAELRSIPAGGTAATSVVGCPGTLALKNGTGVPRNLKYDWTPTSLGLISSTIIGNDEMVCGGGTLTTFYRFYVIDGANVTHYGDYQISANFTLETATPLAGTPTAPLNQYLLLNPGGGSNQSIAGILTVNPQANSVDVLTSSRFTDTSPTGNFLILKTAAGTTLFKVDISGNQTIVGQIISSLATGTAPLSIASTTVVPNLNVSQLLGATWAAPGAIGGTTPGAGAFTTISATGQVTSTLATGTAPFVIASTTNVPNLNASSLAGATFAAPGPIGSTTPSTGKFTTLTETNLLISNAAPTISSGFGTSPSIGTANGTAIFQVSVGTGGTASSGVLGLPTAANGWNCSCDDLSTLSTTVFKCRMTANTTTTATIGNFNSSAVSAAWASADVVEVRCLAR